MIQPGDHVLLYNSDRMNHLLLGVPAKGRFSTHRGHVEYSDVVGREYGDSCRTHMGVRFFLLRPTLADLELRVRRTTTIVYPKDAGLLLMRTMVFPGARVIEVGSGSGALTAILANFVRPDGRVYSFERRAEFSANARANVARYGLDGYCEFFVRDPEREGFGVEGADAVLLDVPEPWTLVGPARSALKPGNVAAAIIPTTEQIRRTVSAMEVEGFVRIQVREVMERGWFARQTGLRPADRMVAHTVFVVLGHRTTETGKVEAGTGESESAGAGDSLEG